MEDVPMGNETNSNSSESFNETASLQQHHTPEFLQRKIYFLMDQLKEMHSELPEHEYPTICSPSWQIVF
ncbi:gonadal protein gdl isoform X2 [Drosophila hydei]|uniref:Gonadal protein gdl isoform X2 n=1 Tax=Drosophila hydei TaxID=7224 RepID=A0A6J1LE83_DROHY|nr:gonadal protein gdl isoform X2 [Drosophila hydei]